MDENIIMDLEPIRQAMIKIQAGNQVEFANVYNLLQGGSGLTPQQRASLYSSYSGTLGKQIPLFVETIKKQDYWSTTLTGTQPLFLGGKIISAANIAAKEKEIAEAELEKTKNEITSEVISNYLNVVLMQNVIIVRQNVYSGMTQHRNDAKRIYDEGMIAKNQFLRSEVALADAERNLSDDKNKLSLAILALKNSMGVNSKEDIDFQDELVYKSVSDSLDNLKSDAYVSQPIFKIIQLKKDQISDKYKLERSEFLPKIFLFGRYEIMDKYLSILEPKWIVGIQGSINLFNGFKDKNKMQQTKHQGKEIEYLESDTKSKIDLLLEKNYRDMLNSKYRFEKLEANINLAEENLRLTSGRFQTGMSTSLDVIDAQLVLEKNLIERKFSLFEYYKSINEIYLTTGNPKDFLNVWYKQL
jgi:outer membrane protein TolC